MNKRGSLLSDDGDMSDINISPMIDMVFILLIFFIVTTVFVEEPGVEITREYATQYQPLPKYSLLIAVTASDTVVYGGNEIGLAGIRPIVRRFVQQDEDIPVILQIDREASSGVAIRAVDEAKLAGAKFVSFSTAATNR